MLLGADVERQRAVAASFDRRAARLRRLRSELDASVRSADWHGGKGAEFRRAWLYVHGPKVERAAVVLSDTANELRRQAGQQAFTSTATASAGLAGLLPKIPWLSPGTTTPATPPQPEAPEAPPLPNRITTESIALSVGPAEGTVIMTVEHFADGTAKVTLRGSAGGSAGPSWGAYFGIATEDWAHVGGAYAAGGRGSGVFFELELAMTSENALAFAKNPSGALIAGFGAKIAKAGGGGLKHALLGLVGDDGSGFFGTVLGGIGVLGGFVTNAAADLADGDGHGSDFTVSGLSIGKYESLGGTAAAGAMQPGFSAGAIGEISGTHETRYDVLAGQASTTWALSVEGMATKTGPLAELIGPSGTWNGAANIEVTVTGSKVEASATVQNGREVTTYAAETSSPTSAAVAAITSSVAVISSSGVMDAASDLVTRVAGEPQQTYRVIDSQTVQGGVAVGEGGSGKIHYRDMVAIDERV